jgi:GTPase
MGLDAAGKSLRVDANAARQKHFSTVRTLGRRVITFVDLAGHERYLKTTILGLSGLLPDYALVMVGLNMGVSKMTREHLGLALGQRDGVCSCVCFRDNYRVPMRLLCCGRRRQ